MGAQKEDPRTQENSRWKKEAEEIAYNWYKDIDMQLVDINMGEVLEYWIVYRIIGIFEHGR